MNRVYAGMVSANTLPGDEMSENAATENATETATDGFVGTISEQAQATLATIQRQQIDIQNQLGQLTLHEHQLVANMNNLQVQAKRILDEEAVRLGIPKGKPWQVTPDGKARLVD